MMDAMEVAAALRRAAESCDGCQFASVARGTDDCSRFSCDECQDRFSAWLNDAADAIERCALPGGAEWPRFEDGGLVKFGDVIGVPDGAWMEHPVDQVLFTEDGNVEVFGDGNSVAFERGETAKRIVLAADGEPLEVGQTVWFVDEADGSPRFVKVVDGHGVCITEFDEDGDPYSGHVGYYPASGFTHQRPVLDADGVPIKVGDTVYFTDGREQKCNTVVNAKYGYKDEAYVQLGTLNEAGHPTYTNCSCIDPSQLTHTKPEIDTWERIEEDAKVMANPTLEERVSLVSRCRALAERGE